MKLKLYFLTIYLILSLNLGAQIEKSVTFASPTVSGLSNLNDIPVGYYSGTVDISIPLFEIQIGDISLPITLTYNSSGIKVEEKAGWVGLGWSLSAGGCISRQLNGIADEEAGGFYNYTGPKIKEIVGSNPVWYNYLNQIGLGEDKSAILNSIFNGYGGALDGQPDIFSINVPSISGKFFFNNDKKIVSLPFNNNKVVFDNSAKLFTVQNTKGVLYKFDGGSEIVYPSSGGNYKNSWFLGQIRDQYGRFVKLHYKSNYTTLWERVYDRLYFNSSVSDHEELFTTNGYSTPTIDSIVSNNCKIVFYSNKNRIDIKNDVALDSIKIFNTSNEVIKKVAFFYTYFQSNDALDPNYEGNNNSTKRLRLDKLTVDGDQNYVFTYNATPLPGRFSKAQDLWGYYNGNNNKTLIPYYFPNMSDLSIVLNGNSNRIVNPSTIQAGVLTNIKYPTGGSTAFEYEPHQIYCRKLNCMPGFVAYTAASFAKVCRTINTSYSYSEAFEIKTGSKNLLITHNEVSNSPNYRNNCTIDIVDAETLGQKTCINITEPPTRPRAISSGNYKIRTQMISSNPTIIYFILVNLSWEVPTEEIIPNYNPYVNRTVGGLRIKTIRYLDSNNDVSKTINYAYTLENSPTVSSGGVVNFPVFSKKLHPIFFSLNTSTCQLTYLSSDVTNSMNNVGYTNYSNIPLAFNSGNYVGYSCVTETIGDNGRGGKIVHTFTDEETDPDNVLPSSYGIIQPTISEEWNRGLPLFTRYYAFENNAYKLIQEKENYYSRVHLNYTDPMNAIGLSTHSYTVEGMGNDHVACFQNAHLILWRPVPLVTGWNKLDSSKTTFYWNTGQTSNIEKYAYTDPKAYGYLSIKEQEESSSILDKKKTVYKYPFEYLANIPTSTPSINSDASALINMCKINRVNIPVETVKLNNGKVISATYTEFLAQNNADLSGVLVLPTKEWIINTMTPIDVGSTHVSSTFEYSQLNSTITPWTIQRDNFYGESPEFLESFDKYGNLNHIYKKDNNPTSYIWGYNHTYPVVKIEGIDYNSVSSSIKAGVYDRSYTTSSSYSNVKVDVDYLKSLLSSISTDKKNLVTIYTYAPLIGMTSQTDPNGVTTYYEYDSAGRLKCIKDDDGRILKTYEYHYKQ